MVATLALVMGIRTMVKHVVRPGECVFSIASAYGLIWKKIWNAPENAELRRERHDKPGLLLPGDELFIPDLEVERKGAETDQCHRFVRKGNLVEVRLVVLGYDGPVKATPYYALVGDKRREGETTETDEDGLAICKVPADTESFVLVVGEGEEEQRFELLLGQLDPEDTPSGIHGRLENLGFDVGGVDTEYDQQSAGAMGSFLASKRVADEERGDVQDEADEKNIKQLKDLYGT